MSYSNIPAGKDAPNDIYVIIEIPANAAPIKYEIDKDSDALFVDRFMGTAMFYPANYGYVPNTLSLDPFFSCFCRCQITLVGKVRLIES